MRHIIIKIKNIELNTLALILLPSQCSIDQEEKIIRDISVNRNPFMLLHIICSNLSEQEIPQDTLDAFEKLIVGVDDVEVFFIDPDHLEYLKSKLKIEIFKNLTEGQSMN